MKITIEIADHHIVTEMSIGQAVKLLSNKTQQALAEHYDECGSRCPAQAMLYGWADDLTDQEQENLYAAALSSCIDGGIAQLLKIDASTILMASLNMKTIDDFNGKFEFLSNFYASVVHYDGMEFPTIEHAFQAAKSLDKDERLKIRNAKHAADAKKLGRKVTLRKDWENIKLDVMLELVREKFTIPELRQLLLDTGDAELIEGNWWGDQFWGVCRGIGTNHLGKTLMRVRREIREANGT